VNDTTAADLSHCPRCARVFHCGARDAQPCGCTTLTLGAELLAALRREYTGCLCLDCLRELAPPGPAPVRRPTTD
jgi:hypothetical protein